MTRKTGTVQEPLTNKKDADGLTARQRAFVLEYVANGGNGTQAAIASGYGQAGAARRASELLRKKAIQAAISEETGHQIVRAAPKAMRVVEALMDESSQDSVRLTAARDTLNRAGHGSVKPPSQRAEKLTAEQILKDLKRLKEEIAELESQLMPRPQAPADTPTEEENPVTRH